MDPNSIQTPASPLGNFPELAAMARSSFQLPLSNARAGAQANEDQTTVANQKAAAAAAEAAAKARQSAFADASKYRVIQKPDGGYAFYDPDGNPVTAQQYAQIAGKLPSDVLKDSQNPIDQQYIQDSKNLANYYKAKAQSSFDKGQAAVAKQIEQQVKKAYGINLANTPHQQILNQFYSNYPTVYGNNENNKPGFTGNNLFIPSRSTAVGQLGGQSRVNLLNQRIGGGKGLQL